MNTVTLHDLMTRLQVYIEGVKVGYSREFQATMRELDADMRSKLSNVTAADMGALDKAALAALLSALKKSQTAIFDAYTKRLIAFLTDFLAVDTELLGEGFVEAFGVEREMPTHSRIWSIATNAPIPANGLLLLPFVAGFAASAVANGQNMVRRAYANKQTVQELRAAFSGTKAANFRDGALARLNTQNAAVVHTAIQHLNMQAAAGLAAVFSRQYDWLSVIDEGTTDICLRRNRTRYFYGKGPLPPAHIRCRSQIVPVDPSRGDPEPPKSYGMWVASQPRAVQVDLIGEARANALRAGKLRPGKIAFDEPGELNLEQLRAKRGLIIAPSE